MMSRLGWVASASANSGKAEELPSIALDGNTSTRWTSGAGLSTGMWFQLDMGYPRDFDQIKIESSASDFPDQGFSVYATDDTSKLGTAIYTGNATVTTTITLAKAARSQYIRLVSGTGSGNWWSINEINVRCSPSTSPVRLAPVVVNESSLRMNVSAQNKSVLVQYSVPEAGWVTIERFSLNGSRIGVLVNGFRNAGTYTFACDTDRLRSKMILFKINFKGNSQLRKVILAN
jgi:hypothetical protein